MLEEKVEKVSLKTTSTLKVLFLNTRDSLGADVTVHLMLARALDQSQVSVWAATSLYEAPGPSTRAAFEAIPGLKLLPLDLGRPMVGAHGLKRLLALVQNGRSLLNLLKLAWICRREKIKLIHITERPRDALFGLLLARLSGSKCLIHAHTGYYRHNNSTLNDWVLRQADAVVGVSNFTAETFRRAAGFSTKKVFALHNAVDSQVFRPDIAPAARLAMRQQLHVPATAPLIGCVARLSRWKDQANLLEAFALVRAVRPEAHLVLAGFSTDNAPDGIGSYEDYLVRRIKALGLEGSVTFAGFVPAGQMPDFYAAIDVLAHPAHEEPFGLAVVEAMAAARPVVATDEGGIPEIIRDGQDGLLVPSKQPAVLAEALLRILNDARLAEKLAKAGRARVVSLFTPQLQARRMLEIYSQVLAVN